MGSYDGRSKRPTVRVADRRSPGLRPFMSSSAPAVERRLDRPGPGAPFQPSVNDLAIRVGTVNGSGSQTANLVLLRALHGMGIPCGGKNIFPSNIEGLPT